MAPPGARPQSARPAVGTAHRDGRSRPTASALEVVTSSQTAFVPFGGQAVHTFQQPASRGPSPPPIQQELPPPAGLYEADNEVGGRQVNDEAQRQALEMNTDEELSQDAWGNAQGTSSQQSESSTPHYNCTPDDNAPMIAARPPPPPSPKSHHRSSMSRYTGSSQDTSDSDDEALPSEEEEIANLEAGAGEGDGSQFDMDSALEPVGADDGSDPQSPAFQISGRALSTNGGLNLPSSTPTPDGSRTAVEDESISMGVTEAPDDVPELSAPPSRGNAGSARGSAPADKMVATQTERKPARANVNKWSMHEQSKRKSGSKSSIAGETHDQASEYEWLEKLGEGSSGEVTKVRKHIDGWVYAMKKSKKRVVTKSERERSLEEVFVLVAIQSPFIVRYYHSFIQESHLHILLEYCEGHSLERLVEEQRACCEHYLLCMLWDMSRALVHLHDRPGRPMVHLDIKPENIFSVNSLSPYETGQQDTAVTIAHMDVMAMAEEDGPQAASPAWGEKLAGGDGGAKSPLYPKPRAAAAASPPARLDPMEPRFKLGDCGLVRSAEVSEGDDAEEGDRRYISREFLEDNHDMLPKADIFALGITLYELASGRPLPDGGQRGTDLRDGKLEDLPQLSNAFKGLIRAMMHPDPQERPSASWLASMAEKELVAQTAEAQEVASFGRVPRKSGPFSPLESPILQPNGVPSPVLGGASPAAGTLREQQLEQQATEMREEMNRYKQQLTDANAEIGRLTGRSPAASSGIGSQSSQGDASPELCSQCSTGAFVRAVAGGNVAMSDDDDETENEEGGGAGGERKQLSFEDAAAESPGNTSFGSIDAEMSQEL